VQTRGGLRKELMEHLRSRRPIWRSLHTTAKADQRGRIPDAVSISQRPASFEDRAVPGHWKGDLLYGSKKSYVITLVECHSRYMMLAKVPNREAQTVVNALIRQARKRPDELDRSLTWDRGKELADHKRFSMETDIDVYFCDPQSPWQCGTSENTDRLLRQYFPINCALLQLRLSHLRDRASPVASRGTPSND
jgi:transposase, IS30 family